MIIFLTRPLRAAIGWTVLAEVVRRHACGGDLRIIEKPVAGEAHQALALLRAVASSDGKPGADNELGAIDLEAGVLRGVGGTGEGVELLDAWVQSEAPAEVVALAEAELGLPPVAAKGPRDRWAFGPRALAALLGFQLKRETFLDARMCVIDPAGAADGPGFHDFSPIAAAAGEGGASRPGGAASCWSLHAGPARELKGVFRADGFLSSAERPEQVHDLFQTYRRRRSLGDVIGQAVGILGL